jgi:hypothetical protein
VLVDNSSNVTLNKAGAQGTSASAGEIRVTGTSSGATIERSSLGGGNSPGVQVDGGATGTSSPRTCSA